jgi:hypothetical protein
VKVLAVVRKGQDAKKGRRGIDPDEAEDLERGHRQEIPARRPMLPKRHCWMPDFNLTKRTDSYPSLARSALTVRTAGFFCAL